MTMKKPELPFVLRLFFLITLLPVAFEMAVALALWRLPRIGHAIAPYLAQYVVWRNVVVDHWIVASVIAAVSIVAVVLLARKAMLFWHNVVVAKVSGAELKATVVGFPKLIFELEPELANTPKGKYFVGLDERKKPVYLTEWDLDTHGHIMGHTGTGKTRSVLEPLMFQDMKAGKGLLFMDAKGSSENVQILKAMAVQNGRSGELKVFAPAYLNWSQTYNPVYLGKNGDPLAAAERVFSVFPLEHEYYKGQSKQFFYNLIRLMAGTGKAFNLTDIRLAVADDEVLSYVFSLSDDRTAKYEIKQQLAQLGKRRHETFTGLYNALAEYEHPLLNSYNPDIIIEDIMNERGMVYFNLPANRYPLLAPAIGKIVLQHVKAVGALRQIDRKHYDQTPFAVNIDELNRFAFDELVPALNMLRDAHVQFRLSHQSLGDLEQVSPEFARQVRDNTRWKIALFENDPDHLEKVARSYGTRTAFKKTVRFSVGPLLTFLNSGEVSNREVEEFVLHPNALKNLAPQGQGYLLLPDRTVGVSLAPLKRVKNIDFPLRRKPPAEGLGLYSRFVLAREDVSNGKKTKAFGVDDV
jgi:type IV secretory pathway TraG/TraD family ATPase VirD4